MSDLYGMDVKADYRMRLGMAIAVGSRKSIGVIKGISDDSPLPRIRSFKSWPRWVCWLFGHEPVTFVGDYSRDSQRCLCGAVEWSAMELFHREPRWRWRRVIGNAWRWLP